MPLVKIKQAFYNSIPLKVNLDKNTGYVLLYKGKEVKIKMNTTLKSSTPNKLTSTRVLLILLVIAALGLGSFLWLRSKSTKTSSTTDSPQPTTAETSTIPTYKAESEGQSIDVPTNVDPSAIKNYTLLTENEQYKIRELDGTYTITLYAIINRPDQADWYRDQLREYKQNALDYMKQKGIDSTKVTIIYEPEEAANL